MFHATLMELLKDHTIHGRTLFPGAGFVEMALAAAESSSKRLGADRGVELRDVSFRELELEEGTVLECDVRDDGFGVPPSWRGAHDLRDGVHLETWCEPGHGASAVGSSGSMHRGGARHRRALQ